MSNFSVRIPVDVCKIPEIGYAVVGIVLNKLFGFRLTIINLSFVFTRYTCYLIYIYIYMFVCRCLFKYILLHYFRYMCYLIKLNIRDLVISIFNVIIMIVFLLL